MAEFTLTPDDEHNRRLLAATRPRGWVNPTPKGRYNLVVIGGGTAGLVAAAGAAGLGARVALIERHLMGGDCLNTGCVPSKALIHSARLAHGGMRADFGDAMARMRMLRAEIAPNDSAERFSRLGIDVFLGDAKFVGERRIEVAGATLEFAKAVIATGARAAIPEMPGLAAANVYTNETFFNLTSLPKRWLVLGAGPVGCELAQVLRRFGADVTLLGRGPRLLPRDDADAAEVLRAQFEREGIRLALGARALGVQRQGEAHEVSFEQAGSVQGVVVDAILVAAGRKPNVEGLKLSAAGVAFSERGIQVDECLRTTNPRIYASGDVIGRHQFTHAADAMSRAVLQNALFWGRKRVSALTIPWATYTDPEVAHVGMTADEARAQGEDVITHTVPMAEVDRAVLESEPLGFARVHADRRSGRVLGATLVCRDAGDLIGEMSLAMSSGATLSKLAATIHPYPTRAEVWRKLGDIHNRTRLTPLVKWLFERVLAWQRR